MSTLTDFLRQQKKVYDPELLDGMKKEYLAALDALFQKIKTWLAEAKKEKLIDYKEGEKQITEETLGTYKVPFLTLVFNNKKVEIKPMGSLIIGANGRADMVSPNGTYMFLYFTKEKKWVHGFGMKPADFPELSKDVFEDLLKRSLA